MNKENTTKQLEKRNDIFDMSSRKTMYIIYEQEYSEKELKLLLLELERQVQQMEDIHNKYYSTNAYIERINNRNFSSILHAKIIQLFQKIFLKLTNKSNKTATK